MNSIVDINAARRRREYRYGVQERRLFEAALETEGYRRLRMTIARYTGDDRESLFYSISTEIVLRLLEDKPFVAHMAELQLLPVGEDSWEQRLGALESGVQRVLPDVVRVKLPEPGTISILTLKAQQAVAGQRPTRER